MLTFEETYLCYKGWRCQRTRTKKKRAGISQASSPSLLSWDKVLVCVISHAILVQLMITHRQQVVRDLRVDLVRDVSIRVTFWESVRKPVPVVEIAGVDYEEVDAPLGG